MSQGPLTAQPTGLAPEAGAGPVHDAFISYSRSDRAFAAALETRLERYRPPRDLKIPYRYLQIFRDEQDFTGTNYRTALERHLLASRKLIVVCSPAARASEYVAEEIRLFAAAKGAEHIIPVLLHGIPNNEYTGGVDSQLAFPDELCALMTMPLAASYRGWTGAKQAIDRGQFQDAWLTLLANLYDISRSELEQRDRRRQARTRRRWTLMVASIMVALSALTVWALFSRREAVNQRETAKRAAEAETVAKNEALKSAEEARAANVVAEQQTQIAVTRQLASLSELTINQEPNELTTSVLLAIESLHPSRQTASLEGYQALRHGLSLLPPRPTLLPHKASVVSASVSPDGGFLATLSGNESNKTVTVWAVRGRAPRVVARIASPDLGAVQTVSVSAGGRYVALLRPDNALVWDTRSSATPQALQPGIREPVAAGFSHDSEYLAVVGYLGASFRIVTVEGWRRVQPNDTSGRFAAIGFTPRGTLMTAGRDTIDEWDAGPNVRPIRRCATAESSMASLSPDASAAALVVPDGTVRAVRFGGEKEPACVEMARIRHQEGVTHVAITSGGTHLAIASQDGTARLWTTSDSREMARMTHDGLVATVDFDPAGQWLFTGGHDATVRRWDVADGTASRLFVHNTTVRGAAFMPRAASFASVTTDGGIFLWNLAPSRGIRASPQVIKEPYVQMNDMRGGFDPVPRVVTHAFSANGRFLGMLTTESLLLWDIANLRELPEMSVDGEDADGIAISDDGNHVALRRQASGLEMLRRGPLEGRRTIESNVAAAAFVGPRARIATIDGGKSVTLWEADTGRPVGLLQHDDTVTTLISNGRYLATSTDGGVVTTWDPQGDRPVGRVTVEEGHLLHGISHDAVHVATIRGNSASVWDTRSGTEVARLAHAGAITDVVFSADGRLIVSTSADLTARVWQWRSEELVREACGRLTRRALRPSDWRRFLPADTPRDTCPSEPTPHPPARTAAR